jgi:4'-phosphopantetheinyl transferase
MDWQDFFIGMRFFSSKPGPGEVHLYHVESGGRLEILSATEKERYGAYASGAAAEVFLRGRSALREIAGAYTGNTPSSLDVEVTGGGKPFFAKVADLHFNVSHSGARLSVAFSGAPVGLDVERKARTGDFAAIAGRFFDPGELARVETGGGGVFLEIWTAKEAMLKLAGKGIAEGLRAARVLENGEGRLGGTQVFLHRFETAECVGAVAGFSPIEVLRVADY